MKAGVARYMRQALDLARRAEGRTFPNPLVGALLVKGGRVVGAGFHAKAGGPHAEIMALCQAGSKARGADLYVTLEPCVHWGKTGPCVEALMAAGVKRVFIGMRDPNPLVRGRGIERLKRAGLDVRVGFLERELSALNEPFIHAMIHGRPMVTVKYAASLDGKIATRTGASKWITGREARRFAHARRGSFDAIMVGIGTVLADDPRLDPVPDDRARPYTKIIVDPCGKTPLSSRLFASQRPVIVATRTASGSRVKALERPGVRVLKADGVGERIDLGLFLKQLHTFELRHILVEGGARLIGSFLDARLADRAMMYLAPCLIGGEDALSAVGGRGAARPMEAARLVDVTRRDLGPDMLIEGRLEYR
jgi:diaminohydroxyphosphoribosylaminopyrimidine deaminase/5-amino-6-(5-phosphoribosylamino)uracil reductase